MPKKKGKQAKSTQASAAAEEPAHQNSWQFKQAKEHIKAGKTREFEALVGKDRSILNEQGETDGGTLLHYACSIWGLNIMKIKSTPAYLNRFHNNIAFLLDNGSSLEIKNNNNDTPLMIIAKKNSKFTVEWQIEKNDGVIELFNQALHKIALKTPAEPGHHVFAYTQKDGSHVFETKKSEEMAERLDGILSPGMSATVSCYSPSERSQFEAVQNGIQRLEKAFGLTLTLNWITGSEFSVTVDMPCTALFYTELESQLMPDDCMSYCHNPAQNLLTLTESIYSQTEEPLALLEQALAHITASHKVFEAEQAAKETQAAGFDVSFSELVAGMKAEAGGKDRKSVV